MLPKNNKDPLIKAGEDLSVVLDGLVLIIAAGFEYKKTRDGLFRLPLTPRRACPTRGFCFGQDFVLRCRAAICK